MKTFTKLKVGARRNIFLQTLLDTRASYTSNFCCSKLILKDSKGKIIRPRLPLQVAFRLQSSAFSEWNPFLELRLMLFSILILMVVVIGKIKIRDSCGIDIMDIFTISRKEYIQYNLQQSIA